MKGWVSSLNWVIIVVGVVVTGNVTYNYKLEVSDNNLTSDRMNATVEMVKAGINPFEANCTLKDHTTKICEQFLRQKED